MIAHYHLSVTSLSAITADLGNVNAGNINGVEVHGSAIYAGPSDGIVIDGDGISIPDGTSVSGYRLSLGGAQFWGANDQSVYCSAGLFAYGNIGTDGDIFTQGDIFAQGEITINAVGAVGATLTNHESRIAALEGA